MRNIFGLALVTVALLASSDVGYAQGRGAAPPPPSRAWIGIAFEAPTDGGAGVVVQQVMARSPAAAAGIRAGDRIVRWNDRTDVASAIRARELQAGDTIRLRVSRSGTERELTLIAAARPGGLALNPPDPFPRGGARFFPQRGDSLFLQADSLQARLRMLLRDSIGPQLESLRQREVELRREYRDMVETQRLRSDSLRMRALGAAQRGRILELRADSLGRFGPGGAGLGLVLGSPASAVAGAEVTDLSQGLAGYFGTDRGVLVLRVAAGTPAARAGLLDGDVIVRAAGQSVSTVPELRRAVAEARQGTVELEVVRRGSRHLVMLER